MSTTQLSICKAGLRNNSLSDAKSDADDSRFCACQRRPPHAPPHSHMHTLHTYTHTPTHNTPPLPWSPNWVVENLRCYRMVLCVPGPARQGRAGLCPEGFNYLTTSTIEGVVRSRKKTKEKHGRKIANRRYYALLGIHGWIHVICARCQTCFSWALIRSALMAQWPCTGGPWRQETRPWNADGREESSSSGQAAQRLCGSTALQFQMRVGTSKMR